MFLDNENELRTLCFEVFHKAIDVNKIVPEEKINMLLNLAAVYVNDIQIFQLLYHSIQNSKLYDENLLMNYVENVLSLEDNRLTTECLNLLELSICSSKVLK